MRSGSRTYAVDCLVEINRGLQVLSCQGGYHTQAQYHKVAAARTRFSMARKAIKQEACIQAGMDLHLGMEVEDHQEEGLQVCRAAEEADQDHHHQVSQVRLQVHHRARYSP